MELKDLQIGTRYKIKFKDCCVSGEMIGIFLGWDKELKGLKIAILSQTNN